MSNKDKKAKRPLVQADWARLYSLRLKLTALSVRDRSRAIADLWNIIIDVATLNVAAWLVAENDGAQTPGVDGVTAGDVMPWLYTSRSFILDVRSRLKVGTYHPLPSRLCQIPKGNGTWRTLAIPSFADRVVQMAMKLVLEPILERRFSPLSFGFRPYVGCHHAIAEVRRVLLSHPIRHVFRLDIASFFDTVDHAVLLRLLGKHVADRRVLELARRVLAGELMTGSGRVLCRNKGTPQGGVISPLFANAYLHELDRMFLGDENSFGIRPGFGDDDDGTAVRYADDVVILKMGDTDKLVSTRSKIRRFLGDHLKLKCSPSKSGITSVEEGFLFLGFEISRPRDDVRIQPSEKLTERTRRRLMELIRRSDPRDDARVRTSTEAVFRGVADYVRVASDTSSIEQVATDIRAHHRAWVEGRLG